MAADDGGANAVSASLGADTPLDRPFHPYHHHPPHGHHRGHLFMSPSTEPGILTAILVSLGVFLAVSLALYFTAKTLLMPYASQTHSFVKTDKTKSRSARKTYSPPPGYFLNKDNMYIYTQTWLPMNGSIPKAVVLLAHGIGEHCGRYTSLAGRLCGELPVAVFALDHQGHGKSEGDRQFVVNFDDYLEDLHVLAMMAKKSFPDVPLLLLGHSLGGLMAIRMVERFPNLFTAAVFSAPALTLDASPTEIKVVPLLAKYAPHLPLKKINPSLLCHDACIVDLYCNDPLVSVQGATARLACEVLSAIEKALAYAEEVQLPYLLIRGADDKITLRPGIEAFHKTSSSKDKTLLELAGLFHEIFNEADSPAPGIVIKWLKDRLLDLALD